MRDYTLGDTFDIKFTTRAFSTGIPTTAASLAVVAYPDNSTTEITAGITVTYTSGFDGVAGLVNVRVVASSGNGYASGSTYHLVVSAGTVGGVSIVGEVVGEFSLGRSAAAADLANGTDGLTALAAVLASLATAAELAKVPKSDGTTSWNATALAAINAQADTAISDASLATAAELAKVPKSDGTTSWNATALAAINAEADTAISDAGLTAAGIADAVWEEAIADHSGTSGSTAESLNAAGGSGDPWTTSLPGSYTGTQAGKILADVLADTNELQADDYPTTLSALATAAELAKVPKSDGTTSWNATALAAINAQADTAISDASLATAAAVAALNDISAADVWAAATRTLTANTNLNDPTAAAIANSVLTTVMTESYNADGSPPTLAQSLFLLIAFLMERSTSGTTTTAKKLDGSTTAATFALDDDTNPTSITRAS